MGKLIRVLFTVLFVFGVTYSFGDSSNWVLKRNESGIKVYSKCIAGSNLKEVRAVNTVKSSLSGIVGLLLDTKNYVKWIYRCSEAKTLKIINSRELYIYQITSVPWPFDNRDVVTHLKITQDSLTKVVTINSTSASEYVPDIAGIVRVKEFNSIYTLTKLSSDSVKIEYELYTNPGGDVPAWLINANIVEGPYTTTINMIKQLSQYQSATYSFIKE